MSRSTIRQAGLALVLALGCLAGTATTLPAIAGPPCAGEVVIRPGDTLGAIARRCDSSVPALLRTNPQITDPRRLRVGARLRLPDPSPPAEATPTVMPAPSAPRGTLNRDGLTDTAVRPPPRAVQSLFVERPEGPAGGNVRLHLAGMPPGPAVLGAAPRTDVADGAGWERLDIVTIPEQGPQQGSAEVALALPAWAVPGDRLVFVVQTADGGLLESGTFLVLPGADPQQGAAAPPELFLTASGQLRQGEECLLLETGQGHLYGLTSRTWDLVPGRAVRLRGSPAEAGPCSGTRGTIDVAEIHPLPGTGQH